MGFLVEPTVVEKPTKKAGLAVPELVVLKSPYRFIVKPIVEYALNLEKEQPEANIAVVIPELVEARWYHLFLHNHRSSLLKGLLLLAGSQRITTINVPWYIKS